MKILMIEDDQETVDVIKLTLENQDPGTEVKSFLKGLEGLETARSERFDVVVLDLGLPDIDGIKLLRELRGFSRIPVLIISARHDPEVITNALDLGAEDYILKPFPFKTLLSTLKDISTPRGAINQVAPDLRFNDSEREMIVKGTHIKLSEAEWKILNTLVSHSGRIVPTKTLAKILCGDGFASDSSVNLIIYLLRKKLGDDPYSPKIIIAEYGAGYRFMRTSTMMPDIITDNSGCSIN
jgi:two-component system, OmpR family, KDP operon response regulator KdpE